MKEKNDFLTRNREGEDTELVVNTPDDLVYICIIFDDLLLSLSVLISKTGKMIISELLIER